MKKIKSIMIILIAIALVTFSAGIGTTVVAVKAGQQYKQGMQVLNEYQNSDGSIINDYVAKQAAHAFSASQLAQDAKSKLYKNFTASMALFLVTAICIVLAINKYTQLKE